MDWFQDVRYASRSFRRTPVFTIVGILTLTFAIGANAAIFSLLNALVLRDLPVRDPSTLIQLSRATPTTKDGAFSLPMFRAIAQQQRTCAALIGWLGNTVLNIETDGERTRGAVSMVTGNYFSELGVRPVAGRLLADQDVDLATLDSAPTAVIGYAFWRQHFGGDAAAIGRTVRLEGVPFTIAGVAPSGFTGFGLTVESDVTVPLTFQPAVLDVPVDAFTSGSVASIRMTGRLRPGATLQQARAELSALWPGILTFAVPASYAGAQRDRFMTARIDVKSAAKGIEPSLRERFTQPLTIVMGIALLILLIACVNLASLMLSRAASRTHEMGVRLALGAGRWRLARPMLVEGLLLSFVGACFGVIFAYWTSDAIVKTMFRDYVVPASLHVAPDARVIIFTASLATLVGVLFSVTPAWRAARQSSVDALQQRMGTSTRRGRATRVLVSLQVGLSLVLLTNAGLLVRTLHEVRAVNSGLRSDGVFVAYPGPRPGGYNGVDNDFYYPQVVERLTRLPGVQAASISLFKPAAGNTGPTEPIATTAETSLLTRGLTALRTPIAPAFFETLGMPLISGRDFSWRDTSRSRRVAIISQSLGRRLFGDAGAIGHHIRTGVRPEDQDVEVIGIVADARLYDVKNSNVFAAYVPALQDPHADWKYLIVRGRNVSFGELKQTVESLGREYVGSMETLSYITDRALLQERVTAVLAAFFGALALLLAGVGLYGLMSYAVTERRREIAIRVALGAEPRRVIAAVVRDGLMITSLGVGAGLAAALATVQLVKSLLFGVTPHDPLTLVVAPASLLAITLVACVVPAARAARVDPMIALRAE